MPFFGVPIRNGLPIGLGSVAGFGVQQFDPSQLFVGGTAGAWYDPSDLSTMFDSSAGTTPVAMPGQGSAVSVGLMLDKRVPVAQTGYYSGIFDGTGDYLTASDAALSLGTGDFTLECWIYATSTPSDKGIFESRSGNTATPEDGFTLTAFSGSVIRIFSNGVLISSSGTSYVGTWCHVAVVRASGTWTLYINGTSVGTSVANRNLTNTDVGIGSGRYAGTSAFSAGFPGFISNFRLVKGTAVYTSNFTPPSTPLTTVSGTLLLTCQNSTFIDNSSNVFSITTNGDAKTGQFNPLGNHAIAIAPGLSTSRPELRARVNLLVATATLSTQSVTTQATSYTLRFAGTGSITLSGTATGSYSAGTHTITCTAGTLTLTVSGTVTTADLRPANSGALLPAYQAVTDANTYDTNGFPLYLRFDGIDDGMYTPANLNLSATDKVGVFAGVRKLTDTTGFVAETSSAASANNGAFYKVVVPSSCWEVGLRGTSYCASALSTYTSPITNVLSTQYDISASGVANEIVPLVNGLPPTRTNFGSDCGTGNFGTYPLYIGSRANSGSWFQGHLHGLVVVGSAVSAGNISATESWMAGKTGLVLP